MKIYESLSEENTFKIAFNLAKSLNKGSIICLDGELGVGKTIFAKGIAAGLGIIEDITSPTFTLVQSYETEENILHHFDVYRISDESEMEDIGYEEYFFSDAICLIEWSKLIEALIPDDAIHVIIKKNIEKGFDYRNIIIEGIE